MLTTLPTTIISIYASYLFILLEAFCLIENSISADGAFGVESKNPAVSKYSVAWSFVSRMNKKESGDDNCLR